jgi:hypothetical protein
MQVEIRCSDSLPLDLASSNVVPDFGILFSENKNDSHFKDFADKLEKLQCEVDALHARKYFRCVSIDKYTLLHSYYSNRLQKEIC